MLASPITGHRAVECPAARGLIVEHTTTSEIPRRRTKRVIVPSDPTISARTDCRRAPCLFPALQLHDQASVFHLRLDRRSARRRMCPFGLADLVGNKALHQPRMWSWGCDTGVLGATCDLRVGRDGTCVELRALGQLKLSTRSPPRGSRDQRPRRQCQAGPTSHDKPPLRPRSGQASTSCCSNREAGRAAVPLVTFEHVANMTAVADRELIATFAWRRESHCILTFSCRISLAFALVCFLRG
jgi:hypothetical protein